MTGDGTDTSPAAQWRVLSIVLRVLAVSLLAVSALHLARCLLPPLQFGVWPVPVLLSATELLIPPLLLAWLGRDGTRQT